MRKIDWKRLLGRRMLGLGVIASGISVLLMPIFIGGWIIALLGGVLIIAGLLQFIDTLRSEDQTELVLRYGTGVVTTLLGLLLFISPNLALSGLLAGTTLFLLGDGGLKIYGAFRQQGAGLWWNIFNGLVMIALGLLVWFFLSGGLALAAIGVTLGLRLIVEGWTMFLLPEKGFEAPNFIPDPGEHPDQDLGLEPNALIAEIREEQQPFFSVANSQNIFWNLTLLGIFFFIHVLRTDTQWSFIGFISPFTALVGDLIVAFLLGIILILPVRILWRKLTRPIERAAWRRFFYLHEKNEEPTFAESALKLWLAGRVRFALEMQEIRYSLNFAFWRLLRIGLPLTAILIAVNSIWGFSWYFNSENWASAVWQEMTKNRIDTWRKRMAEEVEKDVLAKGAGPEKVFAVEPEGLDSEGDFSFVVIGDTGEGDPSQMALRDQLIAVGRESRVKFLVLSSDVIYPDGKMKDYEPNFYLPFKGFEKPIYAIPGNHDWFDANEGFNANFLTREAAQISLRTRLAEDLQTTAVTTDQRFDEITAEAGRLRSYYRIKNGLQHASYFEIHTAGFSLIALDTGILRSIDEKQKAWLDAALTRAAGNFKMVILGHPFYVGGRFQAEDNSAFREIYEILQRFQVNVTMAGDTHGFEFYKLPPVENNLKEALHFVNGGGGAYLSIGTPLGFPADPVTGAYAFYPRKDELTEKIRRETPFWKMPFLWWLEWLHGYPFDSETVSGAFDFNRAPFFQSFMEVIVERSQNRVRFLLYGVNGRLRWRDIQTGVSVKPAGLSDDDYVEFIAPLY
jgi:uncharacterized membrane protein HdeD (DUF308 family)